MQLIPMKVKKALSLLDIYREKLETEDIQLQNVENS
jgi:hypothetical protein